MTFLSYSHSNNRKKVNIEYKNTLEGCRDLNGLGVERTADESSSSLCWCLTFIASTLHSLCPDVFLNACAGGWIVEVWLWIIAGDSSGS
jgi:hypothetical protein